MEVIILTFNFELQETGLLSLLLFQYKVEEEKCKYKICVSFELNIILKAHTNLLKISIYFSR